MALSCPHGYQRPMMCTECMFEGPVVDPPKPVEWSPSTSVRSANFPGTCQKRAGGCGEAIAVDDRIRLFTASDEDSAWLHDGCGAF